MHNYDAAQKDIDFQVIAIKSWSLDFQVIIMGICMYRDGMNTCFCSLRAADYREKLEVTD